jgi:hypothetical protein
VPRGKRGGRTERSQRKPGAPCSFSRHQEARDDVRQLGEDERGVAAEVLHERREHPGPAAQRRSLDVVLELGKQLRRQRLVAVAAPVLAQGGDGAEAGQNLDGVAESVQPQDGMAFHGVLGERHGDGAGQTVAAGGHAANSLRGTRQL